MEYNAEFLDLAPTDLCLKQEKAKCAGDYEGNSLTERQDLLVQKQFHANTVLFWVLRKALCSYLCTLINDSNLHRNVHLLVQNLCMEHK